MAGMAELYAIFQKMARAQQKKTSQREESSIRQGLIAGSHVMIDGKLYPYTVAIDMKVVEGMYVWCEISRSGMAVIVGA